MRPLSLLMLDIDHFREINDRLGHGAGDRVLKAVATVIASAKRDSDIVARVGGEEFAVLLPETTRDAARVLAERLRELVRLCTPVSEDQKAAVTVSIGVADATARTSGIEQLVRNAEQALYDAKRSGGDRVVLAAPIAGRIPIAAE